MKNTGEIVLIEGTDMLGESIASIKSVDILEQACKIALVVKEKGIIIGRQPPHEYLGNNPGKRITLLEIQEEKTYIPRGVFFVVESMEFEITTLVEEIEKQYTKVNKGSIVIDSIKIVIAPKNFFKNHKELEENNKTTEVIEKYTGKGYKYIFKE